MNENLLIRAYNVGCGDCILVRVPDRDTARHILIDCGNFFGDKVDAVRSAARDVVRMVNDPGLPEARRGHLDLIVATHLHWDHLKGFEGALSIFEELTIERIWISVSMKEGHPNATELHALQAFLGRTVDALELRGLNLNAELYAQFMLSLSTAEAAKAITVTLPQHNGIEPLYVYRGVEEDLTDAQKNTHLAIFDDSTTSLRILAPEEDIDAAYMAPVHGLVESVEAISQIFLTNLPADSVALEPANISIGDFRRLKSQLLHASLWAASQENGIVNNTSVALLLEWNGRRILFPGDAEHESWRLMWAHEKNTLNAPLDFLKISHHGSHNGTPYRLDAPDDPLNEILDAILPRSNAQNAQAVVSTLAGRIHAPLNPVPFPDLMNELSSRVNNAQEYPQESGLQPMRTDMEPGEWIDIHISPVEG